MGGLRLGRYAKTVFMGKRAVYCLAFLVAGILAIGCGGSEDTSAQAGATVSATESPTPALASPSPTAAADNSHSAQEEPSQRLNYDGLLTGNRATLDVCIQGSGGSVAGATDIASLSSALGDVAASEYYAAHYPPDPVVTEGCPASTLLQGIPVSSYRPSDHAVRLDDSQLPSRHRVQIYIVPPDEYGVVFGDEPFFRVAAEFVCRGRQCGNVTTGVYVPSGIGTTQLTTALLQVLGLQLPPPDPVWDPAVVEEKIRTEVEGGE